MQVTMVFLINFESRDAAAVGEGRERAGVAVDLGRVVRVVGGWVGGGESILPRAFHEGFPKRRSAKQKSSPPFNFRIYSTYRFIEVREELLF